MNNIVADLVKALESFVCKERSITADITTTHSLRGDGASSSMREDDADMRAELREAFSHARTALARAKQLDLDRTVYIKEGHFESYCYGPYIRIPLRPIPEGKP
jgi:hypothetical protein